MSARRPPQDRAQDSQQLEGLRLAHLLCHHLQTQLVRQTTQTHRVPALLAAGPCPAHVQADNGTAGLGPEGSCPDAPQLQVACKTRQVQGVAQPHTAREVGKSHGPTTLPAIVEGRALPSGTQPTRPTQVPARRLGPHPGCDQTAAGPWGHTWGGGNHRGQPVKGTLKGLRQTGRHTNKLSLVQTKERVGKSSK